MLRWVRSAECHSLCRIIVATRNSQSAPLPKPVIEAIAANLKPLDVIVVVSESSDMVQVLAADTLEQIYEFEHDLIDFDNQYMMCPQCDGESEDCSDCSDCEYCQGAGEVQVGWTESASIDNVRLTPDGNMLISTSGKGHGKGSEWPSPWTSFTNIFCHSVQPQDSLFRIGIENECCGVDAMAISPKADLLAVGLRGVLQLHCMVHHGRRLADLRFARERIEELHFCPQGRRLVVVCGPDHYMPRTRPGFIHLVDAEPLHVLSTLNLDAPALASQVISVGGCDHLCILTKQGLYLHATNDLALTRKSNLSGFSMAFTSSALAVGSMGKVQLLHPQTLYVIKEKSLQMECWYDNADPRHPQAEIRATDVTKLAFVESTGFLVAVIRGQGRRDMVHLMNGSDLTAMRQIALPEVSVLEVVPWQLWGICKASVNSEVHDGPDQPIWSSLHAGKEYGRSNTIQPVEHVEPAAKIAQEETEKVSTQIWASSIDALNEARPPKDLQRIRQVTCLTFSRSSALLDEALLACSPAQVAIIQGVDVQPRWAHGAKVFVADLGPEHVEVPFLDTMVAMPSHVMLYEDDVEELLAELEERLPYNIRKVKPGNPRPVLADEMSLLGISTPAGSVASSADLLEFREDVPNACSEKIDIEALEVVIRNTFIHVLDSAEEYIERSTQSAPF